MLGAFGIRLKHFEAQETELAEQFGQQPGDGDVIGALVQRTIEALLKTGSLEQLENAYYQFGMFLYEVGGDFRTAVRQSRKMSLLLEKESGSADMVQISPHSDHPCQACAQWAGRVLTITDALELLPLPNDECTFEQIEGKAGWCNCDYECFWGDEFEEPF